MPYIDIAHDRARPVINFQKKSHYIPRLLFEKLHDKPFPFRLHRLCSTEMCINPLHFEPREINLRGFEPFGDFETPNEEPAFSEEWTKAEVAELVELALTENTPRNWTELMALALMEDTPEDMVAKYLESIGKPHLLPTA